MLHRATQLKGATVAGIDGDIGVVDEVLIDDEQWQVRYLSVKTRQWPSERRALIPPDAIRRDRSSDARLEVGLMRDEVLEGPVFDLDKPLSRRQELACAAYYGHAPYWEAGLAPVGTALGDHQSEADVGHHVVSGDRHVHSSRQIVGYAMSTQDGQIGKVEDLLIDEESWTVQQLVVDTTRWLPGGHIAVPAVLARSVDAEHEVVRVDADKATIDRLNTSH